MNKQDYAGDRAIRDLTAALYEKAGRMLCAGSETDIQEAKIIAKRADWLACDLIEVMGRRWQLVERARPERRTK